MMMDGWAFFSAIAENYPGTRWTLLFMFIAILISPRGWAAVSIFFVVLHLLIWSPD
jgi:hypothetical protein